MFSYRRRSGLVGVRITKNNSPFKTHLWPIYLGQTTACHIGEANWTSQFGLPPHAHLTFSALHLRYICPKTNIDPLILNAFTHVYSTICSLFTMDDMKSSTTSSSSYVVWVSRRIILQDSKLSPSTKKYITIYKSHCTISKYHRYGKVRIGSR